MIIVSQDRRKTTECMELCVSLAVASKDIYGIYAARTEDELICLGLYNSEERAMEVLQEIMFHYDELKRNIAYAQRDSSFSFGTKFYYKMPEE